MQKIFLSMSLFLHLACQSTRSSESSLNSSRYLPTSKNLILQECTFKDEHLEGSSSQISMQVSEQGQIFEVFENLVLTRVILTTDGTTAYERAGEGLTGVNGIRAYSQSLQKTYALARKYAPLNPFAQKVVTDVRLRDKPVERTLRERQIINIALGFDDTMGELIGTFRVQAGLPSELLVPEVSADFPHIDDRLSLPKPPFIQRFVAESSSGLERVAVNWYEENYFVRHATWSYGEDRKQQTMRRRLDCREPKISHDASLFAEHQRKVQAVNKLMRGKVVASSSGQEADQMLEQFAIENFNRLAGMSLVDRRNYEWDQAHFSQAVEQFMGGSLLGICLNFHEIFAEQIKGQLCQDREIKFIFSNHTAKQAFVENLSHHLQGVIDGYELTKPLLETYPQQRKGVQQRYQALRQEVCLDPISKIFSELNSESCDRI